MVKQFTAVVRKRGDYPYVDIPLGISRDLGESGFIPVVGTIQSKPLVSALVPVGNGRHRLYLDAETRQKVRMKSGDTLTIELYRDPGTRNVSLPDDFEKSLIGHPEAAEAFGKLPESRRNELLKHLTGISGPDSRASTIDSIVLWLKESGRGKTEDIDSPPD